MCNQHKSIVRLAERMSYDALYRLSEPKRKVRALTVRGPPLEMDTYENSELWAFNFKAFPSTTGLRHHGYIKFLKPRHGLGTKTRTQVDVEVDCDCHDYRYRWAWANKQRQAGHVGPQSMNGALNRAPRVTNPTGRPGLCKHILALKDYIYGTIATFPGTGEDTGHKLSKLVKYANKKWINMPDELQKARERDQRAAQIRAQRNRGLGLGPAPETPELGPQLRGTNLPFVGNQGPTATGTGIPEEPNNDRPENNDDDEARQESVVIRNSMNIKNELLVAEKYLSELEDSPVATDFSFADTSAADTTNTDVGPDIEAAPEDEASEALQLLRDIAASLRKLAPSDEEQSDLDGPLAEPEIPSDEASPEIEDNSDGLGGLDSNSELKKKTRD